MAVPARQIDQLISELVAFHREGNRNDLKLRAFRNEAQRLLEHNPGEAHMALGMIATVEGHEEEACRQHEAALRYGWNWQRAMNYAETLRFFHRYDEALRQAQDVIDSDPLNLEAIKSALKNAYFAGRFRLAEQLVVEYRKRISGSLTGEWAEIEAVTQAVLPVIEQAGLTDERIATMQRPAWDLVRTAITGKDEKVAVDDFIGNDGQPFLSRTLQLPVSFEEAQALDDQWVTQLVSDEDWPMEIFMITLREREFA